MNKRSHNIIFFIILFLNFFLSAYTHADIVFGPVIRVCDDPEDHPQVGPVIKVDRNGTLYMVFEDCRYRFPYSDISYTRSDDGGDTWTENIKITDNGFHHARFCDMDIDTSGNIYVVWYEEVGTYEVLFTKSMDGGETWLEPNVGVNDDAAYYPEEPKIAVGGDGTIYVVWIDEREGDFHFKPYFTKSTDGGETWVEPNIRVDDPPAYGGYLDIDVDSEGNIYVAWIDMERDLWCSRSEDGGFTWSPGVRVNNDNVEGDDGTCLLAGEGGKAYLTWWGTHSPTHKWAAWFAKSDDYGETWTHPIMVHSDTIYEYYWPSMAIDNDGRIHIVYKHCSEGGPPPYQNLYYTCSTDDGVTWADRVTVVDSGYYQAWFPHIAADENNVYIVWDGKIYGEAMYSDIYFSRGKIIESVGENEEIYSTSKIDAFPNPFSSKVAIRYITETKGSVFISIYDLQGRLVRDIHVTANPGTNLIEWDGCNQNGMLLPKGVYFYSFYVDGKKFRDKLIIVRR